MPKVSFALVPTRGDGSPLKESGSLKDIWHYIKKHVNEPRNWDVEELEDGEMVCFCSAYYLVENYDEESVPSCVSDIISY